MMDYATFCFLVGIVVGFSSALVFFRRWLSVIDGKEAELSKLLERNRTE